MKAQTSELVPAVRTGAGVTIGLCFIVAVLEGLDIQAMGVAAPRLAAELQLPGGVLGQALSSSNIGLVVGATLGGWLADKIGRKPLLIASVLVFGAFTLGTMYAFNYESLFALRVGAGLGFGGALTNLMAMAAEVSSQNKRGSTGAMMFCGMPVGGGTVALISWLTPTQNWRLLFLIGGLAPLLIAPALAMFLQETRDTSKAGGSRATTPPRFWLMTIPVYAVLSLAATLVVPVNFAPWLAIAPTVVLAYAFIHRQALFSEGRALASVLIWLIFLPTLLILYLVLNWLPSLVSAKGFPMDASLASVWFNYASVIGALLFGLFVDKFGVRWPLMISYAGDRFAFSAFRRRRSFSHSHLERHAWILSPWRELRTLRRRRFLLPASRPRTRGRSSHCVGKAGIYRRPVDWRLPAGRRSERRCLLDDSVCRCCRSFCPVAVFRGQPRRVKV